MTYLVPPPTGLRPTLGSHCCDEISIHVPLITTSYGTSAGAVQAAWALVLSRITGKQDIVFGVPNANRDPASFLDVDRVPGPCMNYIPVRARLHSVADKGSLVAQIQTQAVAAMPHQHFGTRDIIRTCTAWPAWTRFSSLLLYQIDEAMQELGPSVKFGDVSCAVKGICGVGPGCRCVHPSHVDYIYGRAHDKDTVLPTNPARIKGTMDRSSFPDRARNNADGAGAASLPYRGRIY